MKPDLSKLKYRIGDKVLYQGKPTEIIAYCIGGDIWESLNLDNYKDNLQRNDFTTNGDIMKVLRYDGETQICNLNCFMTDFLSLNSFIPCKTIFDRKEFIEVTMDEIAEKFGVPVGQLKIKK